MHKVGNVGIFVLSKFKNKLNIFFSHIDFISQYHDRFQFVLKLLRLVTRSVLFSFSIMLTLPTLCPKKTRLGLEFVYHFVT